MGINSIKPCQSLYDQVRAGFIAQGTTLSAYCKGRGVGLTNAKSALIGSWNGPKGRKVRNELVEASGITDLNLLFGTAC